MTKLDCFCYKYFVKIKKAASPNCKKFNCNLAFLEIEGSLPKFQKTTIKIVWVKN